MKTTINYSLGLFFLIMTSLQLACRKEILDVSPPDQVDAEEVWKDPALAEAFVNEIYNGLNNGGFSEQMLASVSDEATFTHTGRNINVVNEGSLSATSSGWVDGTWGYNDMYNRIRSCNMTLERLGSASSPITSQTVKDRLMGQAYFLRAYFYQQLLRYYGAVPLVSRTYNLDDNYAVKRNTFEECVNFIIADCEKAITLLKDMAPVKGRSSSLAAMALKSRVLLYAASDLHHIPTASGRSAVIAGYANPEYLGYTAGDRVARWTAARDAAKAIMDLGTGYKMDLASPASAEDGRRNYLSMSMGGGSTAAGVDVTAGSEIIFGRYFIAQKQEDGNFVGRNNGPNGYHNWAGNTPIGLLVDDYQMSDGTAFSWANPAHKAAPYSNRDPRFYATVLYDGAPWKPRDKVSGNVDPANQIQTGQYDLLSGGSLVNFNGLDTRSSSIEDWNGSRTGYYMRKFIDPNSDLADATMKQFVPWPFFRYTEVVLNYIEASIELNDLSSASLWLNRIRFRAGMPAIAVVSQAQMRAAYRQERRIELVYEEHRYHDTRRWMIAPETLGRKLTFVSVRGKFKPGKSMSAPYRHDETVYDYTYTPITDMTHENRTWLDKMYFRPMTRDELNRNNQLKQNPGY
ncbi:RagB/SusD family nutrient uptake outer membrane protein [Pedobacter yulinensis]|uniref:RagB/SusD family nutrient uptake outer membrane protein n=1 Tax=Pedobacter yulinensis TaxID=2126353 RepID=A0A2T3HH04_9SPHI|nr:RagB/SusD family nutrient uptake outer membrane protein [Pedobacter yulinensis]PST81661.1 RagB/SusD family nutrient uptake outer membrane protein [Pedobacter yulinensis]